jgi:hypothetical protein
LRRDKFNRPFFERSGQKLQAPEIGKIRHSSLIRQSLPSATRAEIMSPEKETGAMANALMRPIPSYTEIKNRWLY